MPDKRVDKCKCKDTPKGSTKNKPLGCSKICGKSKLNESLPNVLTPKELNITVKKYMDTFLKDKKKWIDKYGLGQANYVMFKTAVKKAKEELENPTPLTENQFTSKMTREELKDKIKILAKQAYLRRSKAETSAIEYDELTKFPELKNIIIDLLSPEFDNFISAIDWVAPKPTTFRINLKNGYGFYLIYGKRSWIAQIEGKKYYLQNLPEQERATEAISRILRYGAKEEPIDGAGDGEFDEVPPPEGGEDEETPPEETEA